MNIDGNPAAVVLEGTGTVDVQGHLDTGTVTGEVFVDRIIQDLKNAMVQPAFVCGPNVHPWTLSHTGEALEFVDFRGVVKGVGDGGEGGFCGIGHRRRWPVRRGKRV
jgi:hypothetical protein